jgi:hypothetical protein
MLPASDHQRPVMRPGLPGREQDLPGTAIAAGARRLAMSERRLSSMQPTRWPPGSGPRATPTFRSNTMNADAYSPTLRPTSLRRALRAATVASLATLLAACGGGGDSAETPPVVVPPVLNTLNAAGGSATYEARTSMAPANGAEAASMFDDFQPVAATSIASVKWQGIYCVQAASAPAPAATATEFVVSFHADNAGRPVTTSALLQARFTPTQAAQTPERQVAGLSCGTAASTTWALYDYSVTLPTPFAAAAGTRYWVRVQAVTPSYDVYWGWRSGTTANAQSLMWFMGNFETFTLDRALRLAP